MKRAILALGLLLAAAGAADEIHVIDGVKYICTDDGMCMPMDESPSGGGGDAGLGRLAQGYMDADEFVAFLNGEDVAEAPGGALAGKGMWLVLVLVLFGGLAMNLTPCVLPMVPINLMVIGSPPRAGRGTARG